MQHDHTRQIIDFASVSTVLATLVGWLPHIAALVSIIWGLIRIWETKTVQGWFGKKTD
jgi:hypothetical protein